jgi:hypothetical protein
MNDFKSVSSRQEREGSVWELLVFAIVFVLLFTLAARAGFFSGIPYRVGVTVPTVQAEIAASIGP